MTAFDFEMIYIGEQSPKKPCAARGPCYNDNESSNQYSASFKEICSKQQLRSNLNDTDSMEQMKKHSQNYPNEKVKKTCLENTLTTSINTLRDHVSFISSQTNMCSSHAVQESTNSTVREFSSSDEIYAHRTQVNDFKSTLVHEPSETCIRSTVRTTTLSHTTGTTSASFQGKPNSKGKRSKLASAAKRSGKSARHTEKAQRSITTFFKS